MSISDEHHGHRSIFVEFWTCKYFSEYQPLFGSRCASSMSISCVFFCPCRRQSQCSEYWNEIYVAGIWPKLSLTCLSWGYGGDAVKASDVDYLLYRSHGRIFLVRMYHRERERSCLSGRAGLGRYVYYNERPALFFKFTKNV